MHHYYVTLVTIIIFVGNYTAVAQNVLSGKISNGNETVSYIRVFNQVSSQETFSNINGDFEIYATAGDTISFSSTLYHQKTIIVSESLLNHKNNVVILEEKANLLNEVFLEKHIDLDSVRKDFKTLAARDLKNNPDKYIKKEALLKSQIDILDAAEFIYQLFKKKKKSPKETSIAALTFEDFETFLNAEVFISKTFLVEELLIPENHISAFLYYLEDQKIALPKTAQFSILEEVINTAKTYRTTENTNQSH